MTHESQHADDASLQLLVFGDESCETFSETVAHVAKCDDCLNRLESIANAGVIEDDVPSLLSDFSIGKKQSGSGSHADSQFDFLSPPKHPEMLGRLGRYEVERTIGFGGMGIVFKAFDTELNRPIAIKVLARHLAYSGAARQRFAREAKAAAAVVHEHVVAIHNVETDADTPFLVMQYVPGESLQARVDRDGPLNAKEVLRIGIQAAAGLAAAHEQGVIHRDVKPANILLEKGVERALITDFGLARTGDDASLTHTGIVTGTPHYMSPEQASGEISDHMTDLFSLGSVMYFMSTGHPPFRAERAMGVLHRICKDRHRPVWEVNADIPDELSAVIDRLLQKKRSRRYSSANQLRDELVQLLEYIQQPRKRWTGRIGQVFFNRNRWRRTAVFAAGILVVLIAALLWPNAGRQQSKRETIAPNHVTAASESPESLGLFQPEGIFESPAVTDKTSDSIRAKPDLDIVTDSLNRMWLELNQQFALQSSLDESAFENPVDTDWSRQIGDIHAQLNEIEQQFSDSQSSISDLR